jgi:cell division protease FtsH
MFVGDVSTGDANDIEKASSLVRRMVCEWGMSDKLGPIRFESDEETVFLGREIARTQGTSPGTAELIDQEMRAIVDNCYEQARKLLMEHRADVELLAKALMDYETITGDELNQLLKERKLERKPVKVVEPRLLPQNAPKTSKPAENDGTLGGATPSPAPA